MTIERIFISTEAGGKQTEQEQIELIADSGIVGDRNFGLSKWPGQTLIEAEEIEAFLDEHGLPHDLTISRRNLVTRGVRLNALVGKEFQLGGVILRGVELCEPCSSLGERLYSLMSPDVSPKMVIQSFMVKGGLRVDALTSGAIKIGDTIQALAKQVKD
jgi:MOSC domain-containing protein YiiM